MCGIIAAASNRNVGKLLVQGLHKMEYRGYDSAGIALHQKDQVAHLRTLGKVKLLEEKESLPIIVHNLSHQKLSIFTKKYYVRYIVCF